MKFEELYEYPKTDIKRILKSENPYSDLITFLQKNDWTNMGSGIFATVFSSSQYPYAIKIFKKDTCYIKFVEYCLKHKSNPHLPEFKGKLMTSKINPNIFGIKMEKLQKINPNSRYSQQVDEIEKYGLNLSSIKNMKEIPDSILKFQENFEKTYPEISKILKDLTKFECFFDLKSKNIMLRGSTLVLIDPLFHFMDMIIEDFLVNL